MDDLKRFSGDELLAILDSNLNKWYKYWLQNKSPLATEKDFLKFVIPVLRGNIITARQNFENNSAFWFEYSVVDKDLEMVYQRLLEIAENRLDAYNTNTPKEIVGSESGIRFRKWIENLSSYYQGKEEFLHTEIERCELQIASKLDDNPDEYSPELLTVLTNELLLLQSESKQMYQNYLGAKALDQQSEEEMNDYLCQGPSIEGPNIVDNADTSLAQELSQEKMDEEKSNDFVHSTVEDRVDEFKGKMSEDDYGSLVEALTSYFKTNQFPTTITQLRIGRINKKRVGWVLNLLYRDLTAESLSSEYLLFAKDHLPLFSDVQYDPENVKGSNLYKYFTTKTEA